MTTLKDAVKELVERRDYVTFAELSQLPGFVDDDATKKEGVTRLVIKGLVLWESVSQEGTEAINELLNEGAIHFAPADQLTYLIDGSMLNMPVAKRAVKYKKPHWLPVVFRPGRGPKKKASR